VLQQQVADRNEFVKKVTALAEVLRVSPACAHAVSLIGDSCCCCCCGGDGGDGWPQRRMEELQVRC
jgi:hypothetical protein